MSLPLRALTNYDLIYYAGKFKVPNFRGVFMRDSLPATPFKNESAIVNLDSKFGHGTHWVCYKKIGKRVVYFDSFGDLRPPPELVRYFGDNVNIEYNYERKQSFDSVICGHLCLEFLNNVSS